MKNRIITILGASAALAVVLSLVSCKKAEMRKNWTCDIYTTIKIGGQSNTGHSQTTLSNLTEAEMQQVVNTTNQSTTGSGGSYYTTMSCY